MRRPLQLALLLLCLGCSGVRTVIGTYDTPKAGSAGESRQTSNAASGGDDTPRDGGGSGVAGRSGNGGSVAGEDTPRAGSSAEAGSGARPAAAPLDVDIQPGTLETFCKGRGPALRPVANQSAANSCPVKIERRLFSHALCACNDLRLDTPFALDTFDARTAAYSADNPQSGATVGVNGSLTLGTEDVLLRGSLAVASHEAVSIRGVLEITGDLETNGSLDIAGNGLRIGRDLWVGGDMHGSPGAVAVGRDVHQNPNHSGADVPQLAGAFSTHAFEIALPCACGAAALDIPSAIAKANTTNDNATVGVSRNLLSAVTFEAGMRVLPCGRFALDSISINTSTVSIVVSGRTALFVAGDFNVFTSTFGFDLGTDGELDLFVGGDLRFEGTNTAFLGDPARPSALRIYVAGKVEQSLGGTLLAGQLYAPNATLEPLIAEDLYGSITAASLTLGAQKLHYDRSILAASGDECP